MTGPDSKLQLVSFIAPGKPALPSAGEFDVRNFQKDIASTRDATFTKSDLDLILKKKDGNGESYLAGAESTRAQLLELGDLWLKAEQKAHFGNESEVAQGIAALSEDVKALCQTQTPEVAKAIIDDLYRAATEKPNANVPDELRQRALMITRHQLHEIAEASQNVNDQGIDNTCVVAVLNDYLAKHNPLFLTQFTREMLLTGKSNMLGTDQNGEAKSVFKKGDLTTHLCERSFGNALFQNALARVGNIGENGILPRDAEGLYEACGFKIKTLSASSEVTETPTSVDEIMKKMSVTPAIAVTMIIINPAGEEEVHCFGMELSDRQNYSKLTNPWDKKFELPAKLIEEGWFKDPSGYVYAPNSSVGQRLYAAMFNTGKDSDRGITAGLKDGARPAYFGDMPFIAVAPETKIKPLVAQAERRNVVAVAETKKQDAAPEERVAFHKPVEKAEARAAIEVTTRKFIETQDEFWQRKLRKNSSPV